MSSGHIYTLYNSDSLTFFIQCAEIWQLKTWIILAKNLSVFLSIVLSTAIVMKKCDAYEGVIADSGTVTEEIYENLQ